MTRVGPFLSLVLLLALILAANSTYANTDMPFPTKHIVGEEFDGARSAKAGDMDNDGDLDIVAGAYYSGTIAWWENNGSATPWTKHIIDQDFDNAWDVYLADIDSDGDLDILGASNGPSGIAWWENSDGEFIHHLITLFSPPGSVVAADLDSDGDLDVIAAAPGIDTIVWWANNGTDWTEHTVDNNVDGARAVVAADIDADGDLDIVGAARDGDEISWWANNGDGTSWTKQIVVQDFDNPLSVHAADMDADGDIDILGAAIVGDEMTWWENENGDGETWITHLVDDVFDNPYSVVTADLDLDGDLDILGTSYDYDKIAWWENLNGNGTVWSKHIIADAFDGANSAIAADIDADGDLDILGAASVGDEIAWWENDLQIESPTPTASATASSTPTASATASNTPTASATASNTPTASATASNTPTVSATATSTSSSLTIAPNSAVANAGHVPIVISGEDFEEPVTAELGSVALLSVTLESSTTLHAVVPVDNLGGVGLYELTVNSNGNVISLPNAFTVTTAPPPTQFLAMIYMACDNNLFSSCRRLFNKLELAMLQNPNLRIVVLWDGINDGDSAYYVIQPNDDPFNGPYGDHYEDYLNRFPLQELDSASPATLVNFAAWAKSQYPGQYSFLSLVGHGDGWAPDLYPAQIPYKWGGGVAGMLWDDNPGNTMSTKALAEALDWITDSGQIDVIYLDACLMGALEVVAELAPYAEYFVVHESLTWAVYPYDEYLGNVDGNTEPAELALHIAETSRDSWPVAGHPGQVSVINSSQIDNLLVKLDTLAQALSNALASNPTLLRPIIQDAALNSAHVDENRDWAINPGDSALDLYHFASLLSTYPEITDTALINAAQQLTVTFESVVESNDTLSSTPWPGSEYWDLSNLRGLSLYFPLNDEWKRDFYNTNGLPRFASATAWDEFVQTWHDTEPPLVPNSGREPTRSGAPEPPTERCLECLIPPMHIALIIDAPSTALVGGDPIWVPIKLVNVDEADDLRGVQLTIEVNDNTILAPAGDLSPRSGDLLPSETPIPAALTSNGWQILFTTAPLSGTGTIVELPFYAQKEGSVQLSFSQDKLKDGTPADIEHVTITDWLGVGDSSILAGTARLESRLPGAHDGITVTLDGPRENYLTHTNPAGGFTFANILRDSYTVRFEFPFFLYYSDNVTVDGPITIEPVTLCAGDMDGNGTVNERDDSILSAGIIPVTMPTFDLNADGETDIGDLIILQRNLTLQAPHNCGGTARYHNSIGSTQDASSYHSAVGQSFTLPVQNQETSFTLGAKNVRGTIEAVGVLFKLPAEASTSEVELIGPFTGGFLEWQQEEDSLYIVVAPPEDVTLTEDTEIVRISLNVPQPSATVTIDIEAVNKDAWTGELDVAEAISEITEHNIYLPMLQR
jgi:hypothetical protein